MEVMHFVQDNTEMSTFTSTSESELTSTLTPI